MKKRDAPYQPGDKLWAFCGENLVCFDFVEYYGDKRIIGKNGDETFCIYENHCYNNRKNAITMMKIALKALENE